MTRRILIVFTAVLLSAMVNVTPAFAGYSSSSSSGRSSSSSSSSSSKSYSSGGGSKSSSSSSSGSSKSSFSASKPATASSPKSYSTSKGSSAPSPKVMPKIIPPTPRTPKISVGSGTSRSPAYVPSSANYARDRTLLMSPRYRTYWVANNPHFYGDSTSPFFYLWLAGAFDNNGDSRPPLPAANEGQINTEMIPTLLGVIDAEVKTAEALR